MNHNPALAALQRLETPTYSTRTLANLLVWVLEDCAKSSPSDEIDAALYLAGQLQRETTALDASTQQAVKEAALQ